MLHPCFIYNSYFMWSRGPHIQKHKMSPTSAHLVCLCICGRLLCTKLIGSRCAQSSPITASTQADCFTLPLATDCKSTEKFLFYWSMAKQEDCMSESCYHRSACKPYCIGKTCWLATIHLEVSFIDAEPWHITTLLEACYLLNTLATSCEVDHWGVQPSFFKSLSLIMALRKKKHLKVLAVQTHLDQGQNIRLAWLSPSVSIRDKAPCIVILDTLESYLWTGTNSTS